MVAEGFVRTRVRAAAEDRRADGGEGFFVTRARSNPDDGPSGVGGSQRRAVDAPAVRAAGGESVESVLRTCGAGCGGARFDAPDRRAASEASVFWKPDDDPNAETGGSRGEPQASAAADAVDGTREHGAETQHQQACPGACRLPVLTGKSEGLPGPSSLWASDITYIPMARGFLFLVASCGDHRPVFAAGAGLALVEHSGDELLRGGPARSPGTLRSPRDFQHGPGGSVHFGGVH